jgi:hypothetical protein
VRIRCFEVAHRLTQKKPRGESLVASPWAFQSDAYSHNVPVCGYVRLRFEFRDKFHLSATSPLLFLQGYEGGVPQEPVRGVENDTAAEYPGEG